MMLSRDGLRGSGASSKARLRTGQQRAIEVGVRTAEWDARAPSADGFKRQRHAPTWRLRQRRWAPVRDPVADPGAGSIQGYEACTPGSAVSRLRIAAS
jgi:hypothetical protein